MKILTNITLLELDTPTITKKIYPRAEVEKAMSAAQGNRLFLLVDAPMDLKVDLDKVAGTIDRLWIEQNLLKADIHLADSPMGTVVQQLEKNKMKLRYAPNGLGNVDDRGVVSGYSIASVSVFADGA